MITHETELLDFQGKSTCCIIDNSEEAKQVCEIFASKGFDYNLKGIILKKPDGHQMGCRFIIRNDAYMLDYKCAPSNEWISELRRSRKIGIVNASRVTIMICDDLWTGDVENVLKMFYSPDQGR